MARKVSERGRRLIADWEGRELEAYRDGGGVWIIASTASLAIARPIRINTTP
jgi:GH24 family phage-related lysozyme (muramidase)